MNNHEDLIQRLRYGVACHVSGVTGDLATDMTEAADALTALQSELAALRQELEEAKRDAGRYQTLMPMITYQDSEDGYAYAKLEWCVEISSMAPNSLDEALDAARQQTSKETIVFDNPSYPAWLAENGKQLRCPYCSAPHLGKVYFDQNCPGCVNRMAKG